MALPDMASRALTCVIGAVVGGGLGFAIQRIWKLGKRSRTILLAMTLLGISLGWQSTATIAVIFVALIFAAALKRFRRYCPRVLEPTAILLAATIVHHPFWKLIDGFIDSFVA